MVDLSTKYAGLTLRSPLIVGSSGLTDSVQKNIAWDKAGCGAIVVKSLFEEQIEKESKEIIEKTNASEGSDLIRNYLKGHKIMDYLNLVRETKSRCTVPIIASINCYSESGWLEFASQIESAGADALELNISAIVSDPKIHPMESAERYISTVKKVKQIINIPVIVKSSKLFNNITWLVWQLKESGVDAVVLFNKLYQPDIDIDKMEVVSGSIYSAPSDLSDTLRWLSLASSAVPGIDLAASTGVKDWRDVIKCLLAGSSAVQMVSSIYHDKAGTLIPETLSRINEWMVSKGFDSINAFKGKLNANPSVDATVFERSQFMKYFSVTNGVND